MSIVAGIVPKIKPMVSAIRQKIDINTIASEYNTGVEWPIEVVNIHFQKELMINNCFNFILLLYQASSTFVQKKTYTDCQSSCSRWFN